MALPHDDPRLSDYVAMARRQWRVVLAVALLVTVLAGLASVLREPPATARALVTLQSETAPLGTASGTPPDTSLELAVAQSLAVEELVAEQVGGAPSVEVAQVADRPLLTFTASASEADEAVRVADAYAAAFIELRNEQVATVLQAGLEAVQDRLSSLIPSTGPTTSVDPADLAELRLAAELLGEAATSGDLASVEAAAQQVQRAAAEPLVTDEALLLVRETRLEQLADQLVVTMSALQAAGPRVVVEAEPEDRVGGLGTALPLGLVAGVLLGLAVGLARELRDPTVHLASELPGRTAGAPVLAELDDRGDGVDRLRAAVLLALPQGGVLQVAAVSSSAGDALAGALAGALRQAGRDVAVVDATRTRDEAAPTDDRVTITVPVGHPRYAALLAEQGSGGRLALVLSSARHQPGDAALVADAADRSLLVVVPGVDNRLDVARAADAVRGGQGGLLGTVTVPARQLHRYDDELDRPAPV